MALQNIPNGEGFLFDSVFGGITNGASTNVCNAVGESVSFIGNIYIEGAASSKVISGAGGGKIVFRTSTVTFNDAATTFRIGMQDVAATGLETGVFDVYTDLTGAGAAIAPNTSYEMIMTNGTKTINHLDLVAISFEMTARGESDSIAIISYLNQNAITTSKTFPYRTADQGLGPVRANVASNFGCIIFDDGTLGWLQGGFVLPNRTTNNTSININSAPDEYAYVFQIPFKCSIRGGYVQLTMPNTTSNCEIILYSNAETSPVVERTVVIDPNIKGSTTNGMYHVSFTSYILSPGVWYALAVRSTTTTTITLVSITIGASFGNKYKKPLPFGANCKLSGRTNQAGAFAEVQPHFIPVFGLWIDALDDGISTAGSPFTTVHIG